MTVVLTRRWGAPWLRHRCPCETEWVAESKVVTGSIFGSPVGLLLALWLPAWCIVIPLAATNVVSWGFPIAITIGLAAFVPIVRKNSVLTIDQEGMTLLQFGKTVYVPWSNVESVKEKALGASLVFKESERIGVRHRSKFPFAGLDPYWRARPTSAAVWSQLNHFVTEGLSAG